MKALSYHLLISLLLVLFIACGGDSGDGSNTANQNAISWQAGVFEDPGKFKNACQNPRTGINPSDSNRPYLDRQGSTLEENHWLRAWSHQTYLWYDEIIDRNPADYNNPIEYFELLKTEELTISGNKKDRYHYAIPTQISQNSLQGISISFGAEWIVLNPSPPRSVVVGYTEPNTPAFTSLTRGTKVISINGIDVINDNTQSNIDAINSALFSPDTNQSYEFIVRDFGSPDDGSQDRTINMTASQITSNPVKSIQIFNIASSKVGYFLFNAHNIPSEQELINAISQLSSENIDELVLDMRYNGGGYLVIASQLGYMIADTNMTQNKTFSIESFNDQYPTINPVTNEVITPTPFYSTSIGFSVASGQQLPTLNLKRVFILSTADTCSASEAVINGLRGVDIEVVLIGTTTCGKPYGFYNTDNCGTTYSTIQFGARNEKGFGDYGDGFSPANATTNIGEAIPGCYVEDDFSRPLGNIEEGLLSTALYYLENDSCPANKKNNKTTSQRFDSNSGLSLFDSKTYQHYKFLKYNQFNKKTKK
jgi:C-terminal processing protease CtpA/Prc